MSDEGRQLATLYRLTRLLAMGTQGSSLLRTILREALGLTSGSGGQVLVLKADRRTLLPYIGEGEGIGNDEEIPADAPLWADVIHAGDRTTRPFLINPAIHRSVGVDLFPVRKRGTKMLLDERVVRRAMAGCPGVATCAIEAHTSRRAC